MSKGNGRRFPLPRKTGIDGAMLRHAFLLPLCLLAAALPAPALANDSEAEWALGGLAFRQNTAISMDAEDLYISADEIRVNYTYTNHSDQPQTVMIAFPLPALPGDRAGEIEYGAYPDWRTLDFTTTIDGQPVKWEAAERALSGTNDVTDAVKAEGFPLAWYEDENFLDTVDKLPPETAARLVKAGLLAKAPAEWGGSGYMPAWQVQYSITRQQTFPANATVHVSHRYKPVIGGAVGGVIDHFGDPTYADDTGYYARKYCTDADFVAGVKKRNRAEMAKSGLDYPAYNETWIGYVLSTGANWRGPIGDFHLVIDKGKADSLLSVCLDGLKKISPTQFELRKKDYEPDRDLNILIAQWYSPDN